MSYHSRNNSVWLSRGLCGLALALCLSVGAYAQEPDQQAPPPDQGQPQGQPSDQGQPQAQPPDQPPAPEQAPPPPDAAPNGGYYPQNAPNRQQQPPQGPYGPGPGGPGAPNANPRGQRWTPRPNQPAPSTLTIPSGTVIPVRVNDYLSSDHCKAGDRFTAVLQQPIIVNGFVVARRGQAVTGQVQAAVKAGRVKGTSQLALQLTDLTLVDGQQAAIQTQLWKGSGGTSHGADAATIAGGTGLGAAIGAAADWGTGAAIGAGAGAAAGIAAVLLTRGRPTVIPPEALLNFELVNAVQIDTTQSAQSFQLAGPQDYQPSARRQPPYGPYSGPGYCGPYQTCYASGGYPYPYPAYAYPYPYPYYYPYAGFYYGGWWGPRYYGYRRW
jgi:hypothetical protein